MVLPEEQLAYDMVLLYFSLLFFTFTRAMFIGCFIILKLLDSLISISSSSNLPFFFGVQRSLVSCLLVMCSYVPFDSVLNDFLKDFFIPSKQAKHCITDFIKGNFFSLNKPSF
jgi:hypothetical protein